MKNCKGDDVQNATTMIPKIRIHVAKKKQVANDSELEDVTDDFIAQQNKLRILTATKRKGLGLQELRLIDSQVFNYLHMGLQ